MKLYQLYFLALKIIVMSRVVLVSWDISLGKSQIFKIIDSIFKVSLGVFLMVYFGLFRPKGLEVEDSVIISLAGLVILTEIEFGPLLRAFEVQDQVLKAVKTNSGF